MKKKLIITVGLPRSGKTTWAKTQNIPIVNRDSIRLAIHGKPYLQEAEEMVTVIEDIMVKSLFNAGHNDIIIDSTCTTTERRARWLESEFHCSFVNFDVPADVCIQRAIKGDRQELIPIIGKMAENFTLA